MAYAPKPITSTASAVNFIACFAPYTATSGGDGTTDGGVNPGNPGADRSFQSARTSKHIYVYSAQLYALMAFGDEVNAARHAGIYRSTDNGATWAEVDSAHHIASADAAPFFDGAHTITVAFRADDGSGAWPKPLHLIDFDLATGLWGSVYGTDSAPNTGAVGFCHKRGDGSVVVAHSHRENTSNNTGSGFDVSVYASGAWTTVEAGANIMLETGWDSVHAAVRTSFATHVIDGSDTLHIFVGVQHGPTEDAVLNNHYFYQQFKADNSLAAYAALNSVVPFTPRQMFTCQDIGRPIIVGSLIAVGYIAKDSDAILAYPGILIGTGLTTPSWTTPAYPGIDPVTTQTMPQEPPCLVQRGSTIYGVWSRDHLALGVFHTSTQLRLGQTSNLSDPSVTADWTVSTIIDADTDPTPGYSFDGQQILASSIEVSPDTAQLLISGESYDDADDFDTLGFFFGDYTGGGVAQFHNTFE